MEHHIGHMSSFSSLRFIAHAYLSCRTGKQAFLLVPVFLKFGAYSHCLFFDMVESKRSLDSRWR